MHRAACSRGSFPPGTSTKPGTSRIQSRAWQASANSHRRRSFQNLADSKATSSLHLAFFTLSLVYKFGGVKSLASVSAPHCEKPAYTRSSPITSLPDFLVAPQSFPSARPILDRKSTRLNSSHMSISYAVFCLKKKNKRLIYYMELKNKNKR